MIYHGNPRLALTDLPPDRVSSPGGDGGSVQASLPSAVAPIPPSLRYVDTASLTVNSPPYRTWDSFRGLSQGTGFEISSGITVLGLKAVLLPADGLWGRATFSVSVSLSPATRNGVPHPPHVRAQCHRRDRPHDQCPVWSDILPQWPSTPAPRATHHSSSRPRPIGRHSPQAPRVTRRQRHFGDKAE